MERRPLKAETQNPLLAEARNLRLKKRFAQHFMVNESVLDRIVALLALSREDTVLEIGPGAGFLTERLMRQSGQVVAVELERQMCAYLRKKFGNAKNLTLVESDILRFNLTTLEPPRFKVVGNLPYNLTSPIMFHLCGELNNPNHPLRSRMERLVVMVQKEVGERMTARPGQKAYNALSIALQYWFEARLDFVVPARDFCPPPKVDSAVVTLIPRPEPLVAVPDLQAFARLVRAAFAQRRKTVRNALLQQSFAPAAVLDKAFAQAGIDSGLRAEALSIEALGALAHAFHQNTGQD